MLAYFASNTIWNNHFRVNDLTYISHHAAPLRNKMASTSLEAEQNRVCGGNVFVA